MVSKITTPPSQVDLVDKVNEIIDDKQDTLVSGTNIKTINGQSILGGGNVDASFIAIYGQTTFTEVSNAISAGKSVLLSIQQTSGGYHYLPITRYNSNVIFFGGIIANPYYSIVKLTSSNNWSMNADMAQFTIPSDLATVATSGSYSDLTDKPTIPTVNNATLTIQKNGTTVKTFTANASTDVTANITVPTKVSDLTNDSGFITGITSSDVTSALGYTPYNSSNPSGYQANVIETIKVNGTALTPSSKAVDITVPAAQVNSDWNASSGVAQILNKPSLATVATSGSYNDLSNKPTIPAAQVNSDWNASTGVAQILNKPSLATVATSGSYNDLSNKPTIPTVNNATLTITQGGTTKGTFTANASSNVTIDLDSGGGSSYTAGTGINITNNVISVDGVQTSELSIDTTPTQNSSNLITSGGVYSVLGDVETLINAL